MYPIPLKNITEQKKFEIFDIGLSIAVELTQTYHELSTNVLENRPPLRILRPECKQSEIK